jgi:hypothetical protein
MLFGLPKLSTLDWPVSGSKRSADLAFEVRGSSPPFRGSRGCPNATETELEKPPRLIGALPAVRQGGPARQGGRWWSIIDEREIGQDFVAAVESDVRWR